MSDKKSRAKGYFGEDLAVRFLLSHNFRILARNYQIRGGEIDLIAKKQDTIHLIEVKTRLSENFGTAEESVNANKIRHLKRTAIHYLNKTNPTFRNLQFDLLAINLDCESHTAKIKYLQNILND
jgi:putative endonuclease